MNRANFFKDLGKLPNIIFDVTGKDVAELKTNCEQVKKVGYKTSLVWVVTNRDVALVQNITRPRVVPQNVFHKIHNAILANLPDFIKTDAAKYFDECWILFGTTKKLPKNMTPEEAKELHDNRAFKLTKKGDGFKISEELSKRLYDILGVMEENPDEPVKYKNYFTLKKELNLDK